MPVCRSKIHNSISEDLRCLDDVDVSAGKATCLRNSTVKVFSGRSLSKPYLICSNQTNFTRKKASSSKVLDRYSVVSIAKLLLLLYCFYYYN